MFNPAPYRNCFRPCPLSRLLVRRWNKNDRNFGIVVLGDAVNESLSWAGTGAGDGPEAEVGTGGVSRMNPHHGQVPEQGPGLGLARAGATAETGPIYIRTEVNSLHVCSCSCPGRVTVPAVFLRGHLPPRVEGGS